jgi:hypothetical protein
METVNFRITYVSVLFQAEPAGTSYKSNPVIVNNLCYTGRF